MGIFLKMLVAEYPLEYATTWKSSYTLNAEITNKLDFEITDKNKTIVQSEGMGVAKFHNQGRKNIEILDFEGFINQFSQKLRAGQGKKCDFILTDAYGSDIIVFNEISKLSSESLKSFPQQETDNAPQNKMEKSFEQLKNSIERLYKSAALACHINGYHTKIGLFSFRLTDTNKYNAATNAMQAFLTPLTMQPSFTAIGVLPQNFVYQRRQYPLAFNL